MTVAAEPGPSSVGNYGSASQLRKDLGITGLAGPSQGSANALQQQQQQQQQPRGGKLVAMTAVHHPRGITVTPPEVGAWCRGCMWSAMTNVDSRSLLLGVCTMCWRWCGGDVQACVYALYATRARIYMWYHALIAPLQRADDWQNQWELGTTKQTLRIHEYITCVLSAVCSEFDSIFVELALSSNAPPCNGFHSTLRPTLTLLSNSPKLFCSANERPQVFFEDVRAGLLFVLTFSVQNTCTEMRRISVTPPRTPVFSLNYEPVGGLAPGLDVRAEVEFQLPDEDEVDDLGSPFALGEVREYADKFVITSGEDKVSLLLCHPLYQYGPAH